MCIIKSVNILKKKNTGDFLKSKPYKLGILIGRFQTLHSGHEMMINKACELCDKVGIFIGSSDEKGTYKNPFSFETRADMLRSVFGEDIYIYPLPDIGVGNNSSWGDYVLRNVVDRFGEMPDLLISGKEVRRISWFDSVEGASVAELYIPKTIDISATEMRECFINGDVDRWKEYTNPKLWDKFDLLRNEMLAAKDNTETHSI